jgi:hypothetical protein
MQVGPTFSRMSARAAMAHDDDLPFCVFLDSEAYRSASFDWTRPNFAVLRDRVARGSIELVTTDIVIRETRAGVRALLNEIDQHVQKAARGAGVVRSLDDSGVSALLRLAETKPSFDAVWSRAEVFLRELSTTVIAVPDTALKAVFDLYFSGEAPFGSKRKKAEFPDAANMIALLAHADATGKPVFVVSADEDWSRVCAKHAALKHVQHLSEMLDKAIRAEWLSTDLWSEDELLAFVQAKSDTLKPRLESALRSASTVNLGDGELEDLTIDDLSLDGLAITEIHQRGEIISFSGELFHTVYYSADVSLDDEEMQNTLEDYLSGHQELVASITIDLPLNDPRNVDIVSVDYHDGLNLKMPIKY